MSGRIRALGLLAAAFVWAQGCGGADGGLFGKSHDHPDGGLGGTSSADASGDTGSGGGESGIFDCKNSLDCVDAPDGRQVCDRAAGICVECVARADCSADMQCYSGHCRATCASDKDCTAKGLLCDAAAGHCVECLLDGDCTAPLVCVAGSCDSKPKPAAGGSTGSGGRRGSGGDVSAGGDVGAGGEGAGGSPGTGSKANTGGAPTSGGAPATGGSGTGGSTATTCTDGKKDGDESDVDCGGTCPPCILGKKCNAGTDCSSVVCMSGTCRNTTCTDKHKSGDETDVDCGGTCAACGKGQSCKVETDCVSKVCTAGVCADVACSDGIRNGTETSVDCGGGCLCRVGNPCTKPADCASGACDMSSGTCGPGLTCANGTRDGTETAPDCGGLVCSTCAAGKACEVNADCATGNCVNKVCGGCDPAKCPPPLIPAGTPCCTSAGICGSAILTTICI